MIPNHKRSFLLEHLGQRLVEEIERKSDSKQIAEDLLDVLASLASLGRAELQAKGHKDASYTLASYTPTLRAFRMLVGDVAADPTLGPERKLEAVSIAEDEVRQVGGMGSDPELAGFVAAAIENALASGQLVVDGEGDAATKARLVDGQLQLLAGQLDVVIDQWGNRRPTASAVMSMGGKSRHPESAAWRALGLSGREVAGAMGVTKQRLYALLTRGSAADHARVAVGVKEAARRAGREPNEIEGVIGLAHPTGQKEHVNPAAAYVEALFRQGGV
jgi:hypothetical protein